MSRELLSSHNPALYPRRGPAAGTPSAATATTPPGRGAAAGVARNIAQKKAGGVGKGNSGGGSGGGVGGGISAISGTLGSGGGGGSAGTSPDEGAGLLEAMDSVSQVSGENRGMVLACGARIITIHGSSGVCAGSCLNRGIKS